MISWNQYNTPITINGEISEHDGKFTYLGATLNHKLNCDISHNLIYDLNTGHLKIILDVC